MDNSRQRVRWISIAGTRPQFIKLGPLCRAIAVHNETGGTPRIEHSIIHTGQHYDQEMTDLFFTQLEIPAPQHFLRAGSGTHAAQLARMMERLEPILGIERPDCVIVYGDTNSTLAGALMGARLGIAVSHVEAGCRSHRWAMPEEQNRVMTDHLSDVLLAPSKNAAENLAREGIGGSCDPRARKVALVGDILFDALLANLPLAESQVAWNLQRLGLEPGMYYLLTLHRTENTGGDERLASILGAAEDLPLPVVFPVHPRTSRVLKDSKFSIHDGNIRAISPVGYLDMLGLAKHARKILTDSGGLQKEAFYLGVPCVTLREETEWPETVEAGANRLAGTDRDKIFAAVERPHPDFRKAPSPFGNGKTGETIVRELLHDIE